MGGWGYFLDTMKLKSFILLASALVATTASAQAYKDGYVNWNGGSEYWPTQLNQLWSVNGKVNDDDNFFISRVKPHARFRNVATQVRQNIDASNDKKLIAWIPVNNSLGNALPDGVFDSECFTMWSYVTHWGNWSAPIGRIPGGFLDVAHKNGVAVSGVASVPYGSIVGSQWEAKLRDYANSDPELAARFFRYYGIDGMGYNSEFAGGQTFIRQLRDFHAGLVKAARQDNPIFENIWYDGTNDNSIITFDQGLGSHNDDTFGDKDNVRTSLFLNYNWNASSLLSRSVDYARQLGRDPLDLYAGVNMQGNQPATNNWPLLWNFPISIGLWGAHSQNMFWESRGEKGSDPAIKQNSYMQRIERWFTGGTRNPANCPDIIVSNKYNVENYKFHGMSSMMTARSPLSWDLGEEAFITYFNIGNGKFFNFEGERQHNGEWYNISAQDYQPTWHYWFASKLLGREAADVPATGLDAAVTWDDAWFGGSTTKISGNTDSEYLHLFKTEYAMKAGDIITFRYKLNRGQASVNLVLTAKGAEDKAINEADFNVMDAALLADEDVWETRTFTVGDELDGKDLALVALHFEGARDLEFLLGEFSIVRPGATSITPAQPVLAKAQTLSYNRGGLDAKIVWNMPNNKPAGEPVYNLDVNAAFYKVYAQQKGQDKVLMGTTTSWADLIYNVPVDITVDQMQVRYGVSAVSVDHSSESAIAWSEYETIGGYTYSEDIQIDKTVIKPGEDFTIGYVDPRHESATWTVLDGSGRTIYTAEGTQFTMTEGISEVGSYDLKVEGYVDMGNGRREVSTRTFNSFIQVSGESVGALPRILTLTAGESEAEADIEVETEEAVTFTYTGRKADGAGSQGVDLKEERFGAQCSDLGLVGAKDFSVGFWLKMDELAVGETQLFSVANKQDTWPKTDWGWIWVNLMEDGSIGSFTFRGTDATSNNELKYNFSGYKVPVGNWVHIGFVFDYDSNGWFKCRFFLNGQECTPYQINRTNSIYGSPNAQGYHKSVYNITNGQVLAIGGSAHGRSGIKGAIDNLIIWDGAVDESTIKAAMGDIDAANPGANVIAYWDLDNEMNEDFTFTSVGQKKVGAGCHSYEAAGGEGQGRFHWTESAYTSGCPFVAGSAFPVVTKPTWRFKKALMTEAEGNNDLAGSTQIAWKQAGDYSVTLTLSNSLGFDSKTFSVISVKGKEDGINDVALEKVRAYAVDGQAILAFPAAGDYTVQIVNAAGQTIAVRNARISGSEHMTVRLGQPGTYIVRIVRDGEEFQSVKLLNK